MYYVFLYYYDTMRVSRKVLHFKTEGVACKFLLTATAMAPIITIVNTSRKTDINIV